MDLLAPDEDAVAQSTRQHRFNISLPSDWRIGRSIGWSCNKGLEILEPDYSAPAPAPWPLCEPLPLGQMPWLAAVDALFWLETRLNAFGLRRCRSWGPTTPRSFGSKKRLSSGCASRQRSCSPRE